MNSDPVPVAVIGCVTFSDAVLERLLAHPECRVVGVATRAASPGNADFTALRPRAEAHGVPVLEADDDPGDATLADWLEDSGAEVVFCCGWSRLLGAQSLFACRHGVIGYHPSPLPRGRGRHPIIWALVLGLESTASTFFAMGAGADDGPILDQRVLTIGPDETAGELYARLTSVAMLQIDDLVGKLTADRLVGRPQDPAEATSWRKRSRADGRIDWRMPARGIHNLVRALADPYPGATCVVREDEVVVRRARPLGLAAGQEVFEPGRVLAVEDRRVQVRCGDAAVELIDHDLPALPAVGDYL